MRRERKGRTPVFFAALFCGTLALAGCGGAGFNLVKDVDLRTYPINGEAWAEVIALIDTGKIRLPSVQLPVIDPRKGFVPLGSLALRPAFQGGTELALAVNISQAANLPGGGGFLPNGTPLPIGGLSSSEVIALPIAGTGSVAYLALGQGVAAMGVAVSIREFDEIARYAGGVNFFPSFDFGKGIRGIAGIYTGRNPGQSGLAVFVDASSMLMQRPDPRPAGVALSRMRTPLRFQDITPSRRKRERVEYKLYRMHLKARQVHLN